MVQHAAFLCPFKRRFDSLEPSKTSDNSNKQPKYGNINGIPVNNPNETSHLEGNFSCEEPEVVHGPVLLFGSHYVAGFCCRVFLLVLTLGNVCESVP